MLTLPGVKVRIRTARDVEDLGEERNVVAGPVAKGQVTSDVSSLGHTTNTSLVSEYGMKEVLKRTQGFVRGSTKHHPPRASWG